MWIALETKAQEKLDTKDPAKFVQAEAYNHGKADLCDYLLTYSAALFEGVHS